MSDKHKLKAILGGFIPHPDYSISSYYGVAYMKIKKNGFHQLKLIHDYKNGNMKLSSPIVFEDFDTCIGIMTILEKNNLASCADKTVDDEMKKLLGK